jgi:endonuclease YncB( thermonuclease family)
VIINHYGPGDQGPTGPAARIFDVPRNQTVQEEPPAEPEHYLIAFKDRSIYSAIAYWVDGDTLHYFTAGNTHNQASVSLVDRELTKKLNGDSGREIKLPPVK